MRADRERSPERHRRSDRAQLSLSLVEAVVGVLFVLGVTAAFSFGPTVAPAREVQLDAYADGALTVLGGDAPANPTAGNATTRGDSRLVAASRSPVGFERERDALHNRTAAVLPPNVAFRLDTPHGSVGFDRPPGTPTGEASVVTTRGRVTLRVWYV